jgi:periodic tryptophan protein 1
MESVTTVTSVKWLPTRALKESRFVATPAAVPVTPTDALLEEQDSDVENVDTPDVKTNSAAGNGESELGPEFNMDNYDEEDATDKSHMFSHIDADLELAKQKDAYMNDEIDDSEDEEYYDIKDTDVLFVAANVEEDACTVEVYLHDTIEGGMYVHHDFMIASYPLALEYIPVLQGRRSLLAVGSFDPKIDIWELSVHDPVDPIIQLGKKKGHTDAVISLHVCPQNESVLASGSADHTVRLWDLNTATLASCLTHHKDKVQSVTWHPIEAGILMSASYDKSVVVSDQRAGGKASVSIQLANDPECAIWSKHMPTSVLVSDEAGCISCFDVRKATAGPIWTVKAHQKGGCTAITDTYGQPDLLISAGIDGTASIWKTDKCSVMPVQIYSRELGAGSIFSVASNPTDPSLVVFGASCPVLWNITDTDVVSKVFPTLPGADQPNVVRDDKMDNEDEDD